MASQIRNRAVFVCSGGCGYVEEAMMWDSPPIGRDGELRCPDCGSQAWDFTRLDKTEGKLVAQEGIDRAVRWKHGW